MARTAKTNHVMSLVGEKNKSDSADKADLKQKTNPKPSARVSNPAITHMEEELRQAHYNEPFVNESAVNESSANEPSVNESAANEFPTDESAADKPSAASLPIRKNMEAEISKDLKKAPLPQKPDSDPNSTEEDPQRIKNQEKSVKQGITAVVPELVNQELEAIVKRFNIKPTDSNLWQITKSVLETVRPEFSLNPQEYEEKCSKLRQRVILEMTKAAIKISKDNKNRQ